MAQRPRLQFRILGPLEVADRGEALELGRPRQRALLAALLIRANEPVARDLLIDELWGAAPPAAATNVLQSYVSRLRRVLGRDTIVTGAKSYRIAIDPGQLDLEHFERLVGEGRQQHLDGEDATAARTLREALALWRGPPLIDFRGEAFAEGAIARLEELRLAALELRVEADLALGEDARLVGELEQLIAEHPLRERLRGQLMLALYRAGRQADALKAYQDARRVLVDQLGIEPGEALSELEHAILLHDPSLASTTGEAKGSRASNAKAAEPTSASRSILVVAETVEALDRLVEVAEPIAKQPGRELILACLVDTRESLRATMDVLTQRRVDLAERSVSARVTAFTSARLSEDVLRLATRQNVDFLVIELPGRQLERGVLDGEIETLLTRVPCDVGLAALDGRPGRARRGCGIVAPFGGDANEWAAVEIGTWLASSHGVPLRLAGSSAERSEGRPDASRLLADVALIVQQLTGLVPEPLLVAPGADGVIAASEEATLVVLGLPDDWQRNGLGEVRRAVAQNAHAPVLLVKQGVRPGGLAPEEQLTRFTWTLADA